MASWEIRQRSKEKPHGGKIQLPLIQCLLGSPLLCPKIGYGAARCGVSTVLKVAGMGYLGALGVFRTFLQTQQKLFAISNPFLDRFSPIQVTFSQVLPCCLCLSWPLLQEQPQQQPDVSRESIQGIKQQEKKRWPVVDPCSLWEPAASSPDKASASSVCVSLELQSVAPKIPEAFGVGTPSFCGNVAQELGSFGITSSQALGN